MSKLKFLFIVLSWLFLSTTSPLSSFAQDSLINYEDVDFGTGEVETTEDQDTLFSTEDVVFSDGQDTVSQDTTATSTVAATAAPE
ncbi:hypothetical protein, partial [Sphingobacterium sp. UBA6645]|uniref:hypothetical protein n=1 Tax=Sphingobacterium sp. UBA6645 TaxID=1947511 RepID=UPI0025FC459A